jgi:hypothetical protein
MEYPAARLGMWHWQCGTHRFQDRHYRHKERVGKAFMEHVRHRQGHIKGTIRHCHSDHEHQIQVYLEDSVSKLGYAIARISIRKLIAAKCSVFIELTSHLHPTLTQLEYSCGFLQTSFVPRSIIRGDCQGQAG